MESVTTNLVCCFLQEVVDHGDNIPTAFSCLSYCYFQMYYNIGCLTNIYMRYISTDRVPLPKWFSTLKAQLAYSKNRTDILKNLLYHAHIGFLSTLYKDYNNDKLKISDLGIIDLKLSPTIISNIKEWAGQHYLGKLEELSKARFSTNNPWGMPADITGKPDYTPIQPNKWTNLIVPTGNYTNEKGIPIIDINASSTYKIQNFLGKEWYTNRGFSINPSVNIIDLSNKISKSWEDGLKEQTDELLEIYKNLDDKKKMIAEFFAGSSKINLPPPGFWIIIASMLSQKYNQSFELDLIMYFVVGAGLYDAGLAAWTYKSKYEQPRPINIIRTFLKNNEITSWNPLNKPKINGSEWLPFQLFTFVTPPFPDVASGHTVFSYTAGKLLEWWFNSSKLYDPYKLVRVPNPKLLCPSLSAQYKIFSCGEFSFEPGSSEIEPGITPKNTTVLKYNTIRELYEDAGISRIYGGIHWKQTNEVSQELANWVFNQVKTKFEISFRISSPYK